VLHDVLGLFGDFAPKFAKRYAELGRAAFDAVAAYAGEVRGGVFPDEAHAFLLRAEQPSAVTVDVTPAAAIDAKQTEALEPPPPTPIGGAPVRTRRRRAVG